VQCALAIRGQSEKVEVANPFVPKLRKTAGKDAEAHDRQVCSGDLVPSSMVVVWAFTAFHCFALHFESRIPAAREMGFDRSYPKY
jgi:hypothetical protein